MSTGFETAALEQFKETSFEQVREEYGKYFEALELHPRQLIGQEVPRIGAEGMEVLRDAADAENWQGAVKQVLTAEIRDRATRLMDDAAPSMAQMHASIELFQQNVDLIPGTKQFDRELADRFANLAAPYEVRNDEKKLVGYSIPTQPLISQLRTQLAAERAARAAAPAPAAPVAAASPVAAGSPAAAPPTSPVEQPQAGIPAKAGASADQEDYSTLFGTIGLPNLRI